MPKSQGLGEKMVVLCVKACECSLDKPSSRVAKHPLSPGLVEWCGDSSSLFLFCVISSQKMQRAGGWGERSSPKLSRAVIRARSDEACELPCED